jgi:hypothetical protein
VRIEDAGHDQANAMTNVAGEWFYADNAEDAADFAEHHLARPANAIAFRALFGPDLLPGADLEEGGANGSSHNHRVVVGIPLLDVLGQPD